MPFRPRKTTTKLLRFINSEVAHSLVQRRPDLFGGPQIRDARKAAAKSTLPTKHRYTMWLRKKKKPAHVGKKQLAKKRR